MSLDIKKFLQAASLSPVLLNSRWIAGRQRRILCSTAKCLSLFAGTHSTMFPSTPAPKTALDHSEAYELDEVEVRISSNDELQLSSQGQNMCKQFSGVLVVRQHTLLKGARVSQTFSRLLASVCETNGSDRSEHAVLPAQLMTPLLSVCGMNAWQTIYRFDRSDIQVGYGMSQRDWVNVSNRISRRLRPYEGKR